MFGGKGGIRTPGTSRYGGFQDRCNRPLYHLSNRSLTMFLNCGAKVGIIFYPANFSAKKIHFSAFFGENAVLAYKNRPRFSPFF